MFVGVGQDLRLLLRLATPYSAQVRVTVRDRQTLRASIRAILARDPDGLSTSRDLFAEAHDALLSSIVVAIEAEPDARRLESLAALLDAEKESIRRAAARDILDLSLRIKDTQEIEERHERLEKMQEVKHETRTRKK